MKSAKILIVEDELLLARELSRGLERSGHTIVGTVGTGEQAVEEAERTQPDLILMDIKLAGAMDGVEASGLISSKLDTVIIFLTAHTEGDVFERATLTEPYGYITKPISPQELNRTIEMALYKHDADKLVKESEEKYRRIVETAKEGIWSMDQHFRITFVNEKMAEMLGYGRDEMIGRFVHSFMFEEDLDDHKVRMQRREMGQDDTYERRFRHKTGEEIWTAVSATALTDERGSFKGSFAMFTDITEKKIAEKTLKESEAKYRHIFDSPWLFVSAYNNDGICIMMNPTVARQFGGEPSDFVGKSLYDLHDEMATEYVGRIREIIRGREPKEYEDLVEFPAGSRWLFSEIRPLIVPGAEVEVAQIISIDITEQKGAEESLRESERRFKSMFSKHDAVMLLIDPETGGILDANKAAERFYGYQAHELVTMNIEQINILSPEAIALEIRKAMLGQKNCFVFEHCLATGETRTVEAHSSPIEYEGRRILFSIIHDITDRSRVDESLRKSEEKFKHVFESANVGKSITEIDGKVNVNKAFCDMLGYTLQEMQDRRWQEITPPEEIEPIQELIEPLMRGEEDSARFNKRYIHKDGSHVWCDISVAVMRDHTGKPMHFITTVVDITERKNAEELLLDNKALLDATQKMGRIGGWELEIDSLALTWTEETYRIHEVDFDYQPTVETGIAFYAPHDRPVIHDAVKKAIESGQPYDLELEFITAKGNHRWIRTLGEAVQEGNKITKIRATFQDITERKHAEEALKKSEERFMLAMDAAEEGLWDWNMATGEVYYSPGWGQILGYSGSEIDQNYSFWESNLHPEDREKTLKALEEHMAASRPFRSEHRLRTKEGKWKWVLGKGKVAERDADGKALRIVGIMLDINERKYFEKALQESEMRHRLLADNTLDVIWMMDPNIRFTYVNPAINLLTGHSVDEWVGSKLEDHADEENFAKMANIIAEELSKGPSSQGVVFEAELLSKSRKPVPVEIHGRILFGENGEPIAIQGVTRDITERKKIEQSLRESKQRYRAVIDNLQVGISVINRNMEIVAVNPFFMNYYPAVRPGAGQLCYEMYNDPPRGAPCDHCPCVDSFNDGKVHDRELETPSGDQIRNFRIVSCPIGNERGEVELVIELVEDVTERKSLQAQLTQAQKMEAIGTLAGGVAHDFNNILQVALGYSELLKEDDSFPGKFKGELENIILASRSGAELVQRLLTFSRKTEFKFLTINLNTRLKQIQKTLNRIIPKMIYIELILDEHLAPIKADPTQIEQIILNLAVNARDAMPNGGKFIIETQNIELDESYCKIHLGAKPGKYVLLSVTDTGEGMDQETVDHIYEPFFTTKGVGEGTGLGLAMVYGIVKQHDGYIMCYSEVSKGTTFKIHFPAHYTEENRQIDTESLQVRGGSETVLLVDDDHMIRDLGAKLLKKAGYSIIEADNGIDALEKYKENLENIDLVILDLIMPKMGGVQCLPELLKMNPNLKVVIASGFSVNGQTKDALRSGAKGFINKPFKRAEMLQVVRDVLDDH